MLEKPILKDDSNALGIDNIVSVGPTGQSHFIAVVERELVRAKRVRACLALSRNTTLHPGRDSGGIVLPGLQYGSGRERHHRQEG